MAISTNKRTQVFISYSHIDTKWLQRLQVHLKPLVREGRIILWDDTQIQSGIKWQDAIQQALNNTKVAVLLVSADFMASDFIFSKELPPLLAAAESDGAIVIPVIVSPCSFERTALAQFQSVNPPSAPLLGMSKIKQELVWKNVAIRIDQVLNPTVSETRKTSSAFRVFISYSHKDEYFKDELVIALSGLQRRGIIDVWHDRRVDEAGDEWYQSIQDAMNNYDLSLLLISPDYLASRFIQDNELPTLMKRYAELKTHVLPIIVRPCLWSSEPALSSLQVMPKDGKAIIAFSKDNGERDLAWTNIAVMIEKLLKNKK